MKKTILHILIPLFLFTSFHSNGQIQLSEDQEITLDLLDEFESEKAHKLIFPKNSHAEYPIEFNSIVADLDDDGMDDDWEVSNGLDPTDPKDAWGDEDDDKILNLFEFQLATDPNSSSSPTTTNLSPNDVLDLSTLVNSSDESLQVIRLSEGNYITNVLAVVDNNFKVMIQGGWNNDFSEYNPRLYQTNWVGVSDEALNILVSLSSGGVTNGAVVLDGINFTATDHFSLSGAARVSNKSNNATLGVNNCRFTDCTYYGLSFTHKDDTETAQVFIANTVISNNGKGGMYTQVTDNADVRWRLYNTTISNPGSPEGGIDGLTANFGKLRIEVTNTINWGNGQNAFNFYSNHDIGVKTNHSNVDESDASLDIEDLGNTINQDPLFEDAQANDFRLSSSSPCIDTGINVGLSYNGAAPDMGGVESAGPSNTNEEGKFEDLKAYPNPFSDYLVIDMNKIVGQNVEINLYTMTGDLLHASTCTNRNSLELDTKDLASGFYVLKISTNKKQYLSKVLKF